MAQIPLWIQHSTTNAAAGSSKTSDFSLLDAKNSPWSNNRRSAIYAIDIAGSRIATGGGDGMVRIWSIDALFATSKSGSKACSSDDDDKKMAQFSSKGYVSTDAGTSEGETDASSGSDENGNDSDKSSIISNSSSRKRKRNELLKEGNGNSNSNSNSNSNGKITSKQRLLCKISSHSGSVLTLRFSTSHKILASAGDDSHVILYAQSSSPNLALTGNLMEDSDNLEHWNRIRICRGHNLDVVGLAWAPDDSHLISCSLDSDAPICVWRMDFDDNGHEFPTDQTQAHKTIMQPYKILGVKEHTSTVKGVAFDPAGKYIASSGDDPSLCIWRAFDDWGLESRIDSSSGIFQQDVQSLANLSLFRRISFAPDGTHICTTNAMLRKKNIAAMVSRDGWGVSAKKNANVAGAANLVGHKQPVVSSRHCPYLFGKLGDKSGDTGDDDDEDDDDVQLDYSTLVALGDKKGMVTIWSTKKSRPIFKLQCSESRCTVTDMAWGLISSNDDTSESSTDSLVMLISLLDGFTVALCFDTEEEIGPIISEKKKHDIFRIKYGIDLSSILGTGASRKRLVDDTSGPKLIENVLQYEMEENEEELDESNEASILNTTNKSRQAENPRVNTIIDVRKKQVESRSRITGKKRIQPVLMTVGNNKGNDTQLAGLEERMNGGNGSSVEMGNKQHPNSASRDLNQATPAANLSQGAGSNGHSMGTAANISQSSNRGSKQRYQLPPDNVQVQMQPKTVSLPIESRKIFSVDLRTCDATSVLDSELFMTSSTRNNKIVASCSNSIQSLPGMNGSSSCATLSISQGNKVTWRDHLLGTHCTALDACSTVLALGSYDGSIYLYSTSPSLGWESGIAFRSHAPFVMSGSIVRLSLREKKGNDKSEGKSVEMLIVTSDGAFSVFTVIPEPKLQFRGTIMPPMNQMRLSATHSVSQKSDNSSMHPELAKITITDSDHLLLILCHKTKGTIPVGGLIQGFIYNHNIESWMRISDGRFIFSKLFSTIPSSKLNKGLLSKIDNVVRTTGTRMVNHRRGVASGSSASEMYYVNENDESSLQSYSTRSHCEDRLACALVLQSKSDFEHWLRLYVRALSREADSTGLRLVVDMLLDKIVRNNTYDEGTKSNSLSACWWLSSAQGVLGLDRKKTVENIIIPEMTKNRSLQRLTNEFATEIASLNSAYVEIEKVNDQILR